MRLARVNYQCRSSRKKLISCSCWPGADGARRANIAPETQPYCARGQGSPVISLLGFVGPPPGATSLCISISSLPLLAGGTARKFSFSAPAFLPAALRVNHTIGDQRSVGAEEPSATESLTITCCSGRLEKAEPQRAMYVTFVGSKALRQGRVSASFLKRKGGWAAGRVSSSAQAQRADLPSFPAPDCPSTKCSSPGEPASLNPPGGCFDDWWGAFPPPCFIP